MPDKSKAIAAVQIETNQNNSKELFLQWSKASNITIPKCGKNGCSNDVDHNAYIVKKLHITNKKFILPLCSECVTENSSNKKESSDILNFGPVINIEKDLLIELENN